MGKIHVNLSDIETLRACAGRMAESAAASRGAFGLAAGEIDRRIDAEKAAEGETVGKIDDLRSLVTQRKALLASELQALETRLSDCEAAYDRALSSSEPDADECKEDCAAEISDLRAQIDDRNGRLDRLEELTESLKTLDSGVKSDVESLADAGRKLTASAAETDQAMRELERISVSASEKLSQAAAAAGRMVLLRLDGMGAEQFFGSGAAVPGGVVKIHCINEELAGMCNPSTGVFYERRTIAFGSGSYEVVMPVFESKFDAQLRPEEYLLSDRNQIKSCLKQFRHRLESHPAERAGFSRRQLTAIDGGRMLPGYVWHHDATPGRMQLVEMTAHYLNRHTGGRKLWGGGLGSRT